MKKYLIFFLLSGKLFADTCMPQHIKETEMICCPLFDRSNQPHQIYAGMNLFGFSLKSVVHEAEMTGTRFSGGFQVGYVYHKPQNFWANIDLLFAAGNNFNETINQISIPINNDCFDFIHTDLSLGYPIQKACYSMIPFASLGLYFIGSTENQMGMDELLPYAGIGTKLLYEHSHFFDYGCDLRLFWAFASYVKIEANPIILKKEMNHLGGQMAILLTWHFGETRRWEFELKPYLLALTFSELQLAYGSSFLLGYHF